MTSYIIYKAYVLPRLLYGLETLSLTKGQLEQLSKYHLQTLRNIQSLPQRTSTSAVLLLLGALPLEAELHRRCLSLAIGVINSENSTIILLVQRQFACFYDNRNRFFYELAKILQKYELPSLGQLFCSNFTKLQWKHMCTKAVNTFWTKQLVNDIKTVKSLKNLSFNNLRVGTTHLIWRTVESSVTDVRKAVVKARILTGTYILQKNRQTFSSGTVDAVGRHCYLEDEDRLHLTSRCPAFYNIRSNTTGHLRDSIVTHTNINTLNQYFGNWTFILKTLVCVESAVGLLPDLRNACESIETLSRDFFYKIHISKLQWEKPRG